MAEKVKEKKKHKGLKVLGVIILIIALIVGIGFGVIYYLTKPVDDTSNKAIYVGGMRSSQSIDYKEDSAKGLENDIIVKIMQVSWKFCDKSDKKRMATQTPPENVVKVKDIPYIDDGNQYHKFDVSYPEGKIAKEGLPVIIDIHGGGWMYATKDLNEYYCMELAKKGYCVFSISYRLVPDVTVNEQIKDCTEALAFIRANMKDYPANKKTVMLTGDNEVIAASVAQEIGLSDYKASLLPQNKVEHVEQLLSEKKKGDVLCFVGDGINDAPVLMRSDIGIAMGGVGSDAAIEASDVVLMQDDLKGISTAKRIAKKTMRVVYENIVGSLAVKILIMALSATGVLGAYSMWIAVVGDVGVAIAAILNAMRVNKGTKTTVKLEK